jgi:hypothetical protein
MGIGKEQLYNIIFPVEYDYLQLYEDFSLELGLGEKYGYFERLPNGKYKVVLPIEYDYIAFEEEGIVAAKNGVPKLFDNSGKKVLSNLYLSNIEPLYEITDEVYTKDEDDNLVKTQEIRKKSIYSKFETVTGSNGVVDNNFKLIIPALYDVIEYIGSGYFKCKNFIDCSEMEIVILNSKGDIVGRK